MVEQAQDFNASKPKYDPSAAFAPNSNSGPRQILDNLGYDTHHIDGPKPHEGGQDMHKDHQGLLNCSAK